MYITDVTRSLLQGDFLHTSSQQNDHINKICKRKASVNHHSNLITNPSHPLRPLQHPIRTPRPLAREFIQPRQTNNLTTRIIRRTPRNILPIQTHIRRLARDTKNRDISQRVRIYIQPPRAGVQRVPRDHEIHLERRVGLQRLAVVDVQAAARGALAAQRHEQAPRVLARRRRRVAGLLHRQHAAAAHEHGDVAQRRGDADVLAGRDARDGCLSVPVVPYCSVGETGEDAVDG